MMAEGKDRVLYKFASLICVGMYDSSMKFDRCPHNEVTFNPYLKKEMNEADGWRTFDAVMSAANKDAPTYVFDTKTGTTQLQAV